MKVLPSQAKDTGLHRETNPADTFISDFQPQNWEENMISAV